MNILINERNLFYPELNKDRIIWIIHNPFSTGSSIEVRTIYKDMMTDALEKYGDAYQCVFDCLKENCVLYVVDNENPAYKYFQNFMSVDPPLCTGITYGSLHTIAYTFKGKEFITQFSEEEYNDSRVDFGDPSKIAIAYTTSEDGEHEIQAYINIIDMRIETYVDGFRYTYQQYTTMKDFVCNGLASLDFSELTYVI